MVSASTCCGNEDWQVYNLVSLQLEEIVIPKPYITCLKCQQPVPRYSICRRCGIMPVEFDYDRCSPVMFFYDPIKQANGRHRIVACKVMHRVENPDGTTGYSASITDIPPGHYMYESSAEPGKMYMLDSTANALEFEEEMRRKWERENNG